MKDCMRKLWILCGCLCFMLGCGEDAEPPDTQRIEGRVSTIDPASGKVGMMWFSKKRGKEIPLEGKLSQDSEILINGITAKIEDVMIDDKVEVVGKVIGEGASRQLIADKVIIERSEDASTAENDEEGSEDASGSEGEATDATGEPSATQ